MASVRGSYKNKINRQTKILDMLNVHGTLSVSELSERLNTTPVTIRMDLDELAEQKLLTRVHGGAVKNGIYARNCQTNARREHARAAKEAIAVAAAGLVKDGDSVIISTGSTCSYVCEQLKSKNNLVLITNALSILNSLSTSANITTFYLGGKFDLEEQTTSGDDVISQLSKYTADVLIIGMDGIDPVSGATTFNHSDCQALRMMIGHSRKRILVADSSKLGQTTFSKIADLDAFDVIITDKNEEKMPIIEEIRRMDIEVLLV